MPHASIIPNGPKIIEARGLKGLTQQDLAEESGYSKRTIERIEQSQPTRRDTVEDIAEALQINLNEIIAIDSPDDLINFGDRVGGAPAAVITQTGLVTLKLNTSFSAFTSEHQSKFLTALENLLDFTTVNVVGKISGCVELTLELDSGDIKKLRDAFQLGKLSSLNVVSVHEVIEAVSSKGTRIISISKSADERNKRSQHPGRDFAKLLQRAQSGDPHAAPILFNLIYQKLHEMAEKKLSINREDPLDAADLVNDAYLQLVAAHQEVSINDRRDFYILAAKTMRRIIIDRARARRALKRSGSAWKSSSMISDDTLDRTATSDVFALHDALKRLAEVDPRQAEVVEMRFFGGYTVEETSDLLGLSLAAVKQAFAAAKAWLYRELTQSELDK